MQYLNKNNFLFNDVSSLKGVGSKLKKYLKNKKIEKIKDLLWDLPYDIIDRSKIIDLQRLEIGKIATVKVYVEKYNFPRIRNLPYTVICSDQLNKINIVFFNSYEGYIRKILPLKTKVIISGKITYYKNRYQITNPIHVKTEDKTNEIAKIFPKYSLTEGLTEKTYRKLLQGVLQKIDNNYEWHNDDFLKNNKFNKFKQTLINLHNPKSKTNVNSNDYKRLVYDEILANYITLSKVRNAIKTTKNKKKIITNNLEKVVLKNFSHTLTNGQKIILNEVITDINSGKRMFRLLQGDVGSGKTIIAIIASTYILESNYQVAFMAPTEILAKQHFDIAKKLFNKTKIKIEILTSSTDYKKRKEIIKNIYKNNINIIFGTHSLFQEKIKYFKLGFIIIDEQHKFGVKQRINLAKKGGKNCDLLLMSATPIPRSMMLSIFGDMDISRLKEKPKYRKEITTLVKPEKKINELLPLIKKKIFLNEQIFWVCPLINQSDKLDFTSAKKRFDYINKIYPQNVGIIHGSLEEKEKQKTLKKFLNNEIKILVSTTIIEVGIDFPNATTIVIDDSNKFGLSQLHQLRGRVGRGNSKSICVLLYKDTLSISAKKRLKILRSTNDGFIIAEEDLNLRGHGDIMGYKQSGIKSFKFADPILHKNLFLLAEKNINKINSKDIKNFSDLIKLHDKADVISDISN